MTGDCPRCGMPPVEVQTMGEREPRYLPRCACYPHPPLCVSCQRPIVADRCTFMECVVFDVIQPEPIIDPLWESE